MSNDGKKTEGEQGYEPGEGIEDSPEFKDFEKRILQAPALRAFHEDEEKPEKPPHESPLWFLLGDDPDASRLRRKALRFILRVGLALLDDRADRPDPPDDPNIN